MDEQFLRNLRSSLKERRKKLGITQGELSIRSGIGLRFIREIEQGKKSTHRLDKVLDLLNFFGLTLEISRRNKT